MTAALTWPVRDGAFRLQRRDLPLGLLILYVATLFAIPNDIGLHLGAFVLSPSRIVLVVLGLAVAADKPLRDNIRTLPKAVLVGWFAFLASAAVSTLLNYSSQSLSRYGSLIAEGLVVWVAVWCVARDRRASNALQISVVAVTTIVAAVTLLLATSGLVYGDVLHNLSLQAVSGSEVRFGIARQAGSFPAPLFFATWVVAASMLTLRWLDDERRVPKVLAWTAWTILFIATITTVSRVGILLDPAATAVYLLYRRRMVMATIMLVVTLFAGLFAAGVEFPSLFPSSGPAPTSNTTTPAGPSEEERLNGSSAMRIESLQAAWPTLLEKPLFGWGLLSAAPVLTGRIGHPTFVDDTYLTDLVELGLLGCAAFALLVLASLRRALFIPRTPIHVSRVFAFLAMLAMAVFVSILSITQGYAGFVILMALVSVGATAGTPEANPEAASEAAPA